MGKQNLGHLIICGLSGSALNCGFASNETGGLTALDISGSTLASTQLSIDKTSKNKLLREGGTWQITEIPVGIGHTVVAQAFLGTRSADARRHGRLTFKGIRHSVRVESGKTNRKLEDVGPVTRNGETYIALVFTTLIGGSRLYYSESAASDLVLKGRGNNGVVDLGFASEVVGLPRPQAKLDCKHSSLTKCNLLWLGQTATSTVYLRHLTWHLT